MEDSKQVLEASRDIVTMLEAIAEAVTIIFVVAAAFLFWKLANQFGAKLSFNKLILILLGLAFICLAACYL